jgi:hypothetical protein
MEQYTYKRYSIATLRKDAMADPEIVWNLGSEQTHIDQVLGWMRRAEALQKHVVLTMRPYPVVLTDLTKTMLKTVEPPIYLLGYAQGEPYPSSTYPWT